MNGCACAIDRIFHPSPDSTSLLVHGQITWASGAWLPYRLGLYEVGPSGVRVLWEKDVRGLEMVRAEAIGFVISYHDEKRSDAFHSYKAVETYRVTIDDPIPHLLTRRIDLGYLFYGAGGGI